MFESTVKMSVLNYRPVGLGIGHSYYFCGGRTQPHIHKTWDTPHKLRPTLYCYLTEMSPHQRRELHPILASELTPPRLRPTLRCHLTEMSPHMYKTLHLPRSMIKARSMWAVRTQQEVPLQDFDVYQLLERTPNIEAKRVTMNKKHICPENWYKQYEL